MERAALVALTLILAAATVGGTPVQDDPTAEVVARYPSDGEMVERTVVGVDDIESVSTPEKHQAGWGVPVTLTDSGAESFTTTLVDAGFTSDGVRSCRATGERNEQGYCLLTVVDGEVLSALSLGPNLAQTIESGDFEEDPRFFVLTQNETTAERAARALGWTPSEANRSADSTQTARTSATTQETMETTQETVETTAIADGNGSGADVPGFGVGLAVLAVAAAVVARHES